MIVRVLGAFAIGALAVYFFDPVSGKRRRALARDHAEGTAKDLRNRAYGVAAEARGIVKRRLGQRRQASAVDIDLSQ